MRELRVGVVGGGPRGQLHMKYFSRFEGVRLEVICDPIENVRTGLAKRFKIPHQFGKIEQMIESVSLDAVVICVPAQLNFDTAMICLEAGLDTLLEKPPGMCVEETRKLQKVADRGGARCMIGFNRRFNPSILGALKRVKRRGPIVTVVGEFHKNLAEIEAGGKYAQSVLQRFFYETPIHAVDCVRYLAGSDINCVYGVSHRAISSYHDTFGGLVQFENGCIAHLVANITSGARLERYEIHGNGISAYLEGVTHAQIVEDGKTMTMTNEKTDSTFEQDRYFVKCIAEDKPIEAPACDVGEAVKTMELAALIFE